MARLSRLEKWDDGTEVVRRWLMLCLVRKDSEGRAEEPNEMELNTIRGRNIRAAILSRRRALDND